MLILTGVVLLSCITISTSQVAPPIAEKFVNQLETGGKSPPRGPPSAAPPNLATLLSLNSQPDNKVQDITKNVTNVTSTKENKISIAPSSSNTSVPTTTGGTTMSVSSTTIKPVTTNGPSTVMVPETTKAPSTAAPPTTKEVPAATVSTTKAPISTTKALSSSTSVPSSTTKASTTTIQESSSSEESNEEVAASTKVAKSTPSTSSTLAIVTSSTAAPTTEKKAESPFEEPDLDGEGTQEFKTNKVENKKNKENVMSLSSKFEQKPLTTQSENSHEEDVTGSFEILDKLSVAQELSLLKKIAFNPAIGANAFGVKTLKSEDEEAKIHNIDGSNPSLPPFAFSEDEQTEAKVEDISTDNFEKLISDITKTMMANIPIAAVSNGTQAEKVTVAKIKEEPIKEKIIEFSRVAEEKKGVVVEESKESTEIEASKEVLKTANQEVEAKIGFIPVNVNGDVFSKKGNDINKKSEIEAVLKEVMKAEIHPEPKKEAEAKIGTIPVNINGDVFSRKENNNNKKIELQQKKKTVFSSAPDTFNTGRNFVPVRLFFDKTNDQSSIIKRKKNTKRRRVTPVPRRLNSHIVDGSFGSTGPDTTTLSPVPPTSATVTPTQPFGIQTEEVPVVEMVTPSVRTTQRSVNGRARKTKVGRSRGLSKSTELLDHFESSSIGPVIRTDDFLIAWPENVPIPPVSDRELLQKRFEELENKEMIKENKEEKKVKTPKEMLLPDLVTMPDLRILNTFSTLRGPAHVRGQSNKVLSRRSNEADIDWKKTYGYKGKRKVIRVRKLKKKNIEGDIKQEKAEFGQKVDSKQNQHGKYYGKWGRAKIRPRFIKKKLTTTVAPLSAQPQLVSRTTFAPLQPQFQPAPQLFQNQFQGGFAVPAVNNVPGINFFAPATNNAPVQLPAPLQPQTPFQGRPLFNTPPVFNQQQQIPQARLFNTLQQQQQQRQTQKFNAVRSSQGQVHGRVTFTKDTVPTVRSSQIPQYLAPDGRWYPYVNNQPTLPQQVQPVIYEPQQRSTMRPLVAEQVAQMISRPVQKVATVATVKRSRSATISSESRILKQTGLGRRHRHKKLRKTKRSRHAKARSGGKTVKVHRVPKTHMGEVEKVPSSSSSNDDRPVLVDRDHARKTIDRDVRRR